MISQILRLLTQEQKIWMSLSANYQDHKTIDLESQYQGKPIFHACHELMRKYFDLAKSQNCRSLAGLNFSCRKSIEKLAKELVIKVELHQRGSKDCVILTNNIEDEL